ncbi:MAG: hemolysin family protein [Verrucomicrobiales bacterium]|nr:hemolysin family protein [Verrucomicrobiales bacterium]
MQNIYLAAGAGAKPKSFSEDAVVEALNDDRLNLAPDVIESVLAGLNQSADTSGSGSLFLLIFFFTLAIGVSFFCSVWEAVLLSVTRPYIETLKKNKPKAGRRFELLKARIDKPLISILTLNTIAHTMGSMGVASEFSKLTGGGIWDTIGGFVMTIAILIASEIIPKNLGAKNWKSWAPWVGNCLYWLSKLMTPVVKAISFFSKGGHGAETFSREELTVMAEMGKTEGKLKEGESQILTNLLRMKDETVESVMTPRVVIFALKNSTTVQEFMETHLEAPYSRIPVYSENRDDITGFVLKDDILIAAAKDEDEIEIGTFVRELPMMSELTKLPEAFESLIETNDHAAIVNDEFGSLTGLVTMEDIVETLLGEEIIDEIDKTDDMRAHARALWEKRSRRKNINLVKKDSET